jgi:hypothetical protein
MPLYREDERQNKLCPITDTQMSNTCPLTCKLGFRVMSDEQASELSKIKRNIVTHECLVRAALLSVYKNFNKKSDDDDFQFGDKKKVKKDGKA